MIKFKSTFRTKDFCYFWNTLTTLQQNHAKNFNKKIKLRALFLNSRTSCNQYFR